MTTQTGTDWGLLSKAQVIREYAYPEHLLTDDIRTGAIAAFLSSGELAKGRDYLYGFRLYIPRIAVERRIAERAGMEART